ncbi:MAG: NUDIX domain-containing protein [Chloroflexi bacterium]|nr:NUDIX domain-containing protein [Chloroflexota bacterium]
MSRSIPTIGRTEARIGARGVVLVDGKILLLRYERGEETLYLFPGGGHEPGETLAENARREVLEETGLDVDVGRLLAVHEHQPSKGIAIPDDIRSIYVGDVQRLDFFFEYRPVAGMNPDWLSTETPVCIQDSNG